MTRQTSIEAYNEIKANGLLGKKQWEVYSALFLHGPCTQKELMVKMGIGNLSERTITPRFAELKRRGVIDDIGKRPCSITGRMVYDWDVTKRIPKKTNDKRAKQICLICQGKGYTYEVEQ